MSKKSNYLSGTIGSTMLKTALAMLPGTIAVSGYNLADTYFVSQLGTLPLAAMGYTFPVIMLINCIFHGLGVGVMATVAHAVGGSRHKKAAKLVSCGMILIVSVAILIGIAGYCSMEWTFRCFGARGDVCTPINEYMGIWYLGCATAAVAMVGNSLLVAVGDSRLGGFFMMLGLVMNVLLDPLFIFDWGLGMGISGAALATVISQFIGSCLIVTALGKRHNLWAFKSLSKRVAQSAWKQIIRFALPAMLGMVLMPAGNGVVTRIVAAFGDKAVAAAAAAGRLEVLAFMLPMSLGIGLMPMIAQNYGAKCYSRIVGCRHFAMRFAFFFEIFMAVIYFIAAPYIVKYFTDDDEVAEIMVTYLRIIPWGFGLIEIHRYSGFFFTGCNYPHGSAWLSALRILGLLIPFSLLALWLKSLNGLFVARLAADLVAGAIGWLLVWRMTNSLPEDGQTVVRKKHSG
ncbi:MAG: MATE family efflux transporter [Lentisphaerae bacterium]|nr:MATE family efflux transporter [Lentisphaerota bacterium]